MAEGLLRNHLDERGVDAHVSSAGFLAEGVPATDEAVTTMAQRGIDIVGHRSRVVTRELIEDADLVVTMTSQHVAEVAVMEPHQWGRAFTLRDLVRRADAKGPRLPEEPMAAWISRLNSGRTPRDVLSAASSDDVADPIGQPLAAYQKTADELDELLRRLAAILR